MREQRPDTTLDDRWHAPLGNPAVAGAVHHLQRIVPHESPAFAVLDGRHEGQGPLISRPRTLGDLMFLLRKGRCR